MKNMMTVDGHHAVVAYDSDIRMFRGSFLGLNGGADFYAASVDGLEHEARISLEEFMAMCEEKGIAPARQYSGRFNVRLAPEIHAAAAIAAAAEDKSLNEWVAETIKVAAEGAS